MICCVWLCSDSGYNGILPDAGKYATGLLFLDRATASQAEETFTKYAEKYGLQVRGCFQDFSLVAKLEPDINMEICWRQSDWEHQDYFFLPENCVNYVCQPKTWSIVYFIMRLLFWRGLGSVMCFFLFPATDLMAARFFFCKFCPDPDFIIIHLCSYVPVVLHLIVWSKCPL